MLKIEIMQDDAYTDFWGHDVDENWKFISFHRHAGNDPYEYLAPPDRYGDVDGATPEMRRKLAINTAFILSCYSHSGESWGTYGRGT